jgi:hypothetical protein
MRTWWELAELALPMQGTAVVTSSPDARTSIASQKIQSA